MQIENYLREIFVGVGSIIIGALSIWVKLKNVNHQNDDNIAKNKNKHTETILHGYGKIVEDLRTEVNRLNSVIFDLRKEQEECERRNEEMAKVVEELRQRVSFLEGESSA